MAREFALAFGVVIVLEIVEHVNCLLLWVLAIVRVKIPFALFDISVPSANNVYLVTTGFASPWQVTVRESPISNNATLLEVVRLGVFMKSYMEKRI